MSTEIAASQRRRRKSINESPNSRETSEKESLLAAEESVGAKKGSLNHVKSDSGPEGDRGSFSSRRKQFVERALELKERGNTLFRLEKHEEAVAEYSLAIHELTFLFDRECALTRAVIFNNRAVCLLKLNSFVEVLRDSSFALELCSRLIGEKEEKANQTYLKALFRQAKAFQAIGNMARALEAFSRSAELIKTFKITGFEVVRPPDVIPLRICPPARAPGYFAPFERCPLFKSRLDTHLIREGRWASHIAGGTVPKWRSAPGAVVFRSSLFLFGGNRYHASDERSVVLDDLDRLDLKTMTWSACERHPGAPSGRSHFSSVVCHGKMWVFGGERMQNSEVSNEMYALDLLTMKWSGVSMKGDLPCARHSHGAALWRGLKRSHDLPCVRGDESFCRLCFPSPRMIVFGGIDRSIRFLSDLYSFDFATREWTKLEEGIPEDVCRMRISGSAESGNDGKKEHPSCRTQFGCWVLDDSYYVCSGVYLFFDAKSAGGIEGRNDFFDDLYRYDLADGARRGWRRCFPHGNLPCSRSDFSVVTFKGRAYVFGGYTEPSASEAESLVLGDLFEFSVQKPPMPFFEDRDEDACSSCDPRGAGGFGWWRQVMYNPRTRSLPRNARVDLSDEKRSSKESALRPANRSGNVFVCDDENLYVLGGVGIGEGRSGRGEFEVGLQFPNHGVFSLSLNLENEAEKHIRHRSRYFCSNVSCPYHDAGVCDNVILKECGRLCGSLYCSRLCQADDWERHRSICTQSKS